MKWKLPLQPFGAESVDSKSYIVALSIRSAKDIPADFDLPDNLKEFSCGVFLPRAEAGWFELSAYPPRVVLLSQTSLAIAAHPTSGEPTQIIPLRELQFVEYGHLLLVGWISFASPQGTRVLLFNTRTSRPVEELLDELAKQCAPPLSALGPCGDCDGFGSELDIKFQNAEVGALISGERVLARFFNPTLQRRCRAWGILPIQSHEPADYLAVTNRRLLWITERNRSYYDRYGLIYDPLRSGT